MPLQTSIYNPQTPDPTLDAFRAEVPYRENLIRTDAETRKRRAQTSYDQGLQDLARQVQSTRSNTLSSLEGRGVLSSGETTKRLTDISSREEEARARAAAALAEQKAQADATQQRQLTELAAEQERQTAAAREREYQNALQIWYAAMAGRQAPRPMTPSRPRSPSGGPGPSMQQVYNAMVAPNQSMSGFNTSGYPV